MDRITYLKSIEPVTILDKPSENSLLFIEKFWSALQIVEAKKKLHKALKTEKKLDIRKLAGKNLLDDPFFQEDYASFLFSALPKQVLEQFNISDEWQIQIMLLLFFDAFIDVEYFQIFVDRKFEFILGKKNIATRMFDYPNEVGAILIPYQSNKQQLKSWLDEHWQEIEQQQDQALIEFQPYLKEYQNLEIGKEIDELKEQGLTYNEISDKLFDKYPHDKRLADFDSAKKLHYRYKKLQERMQTRLPTLLQT